MADDTAPDVDQAEADPIETAAEMLDDAVQARLWLRTLTPLLQQRSAEPDHCASVQAALDRMHRAAADRATRILRGDLTTGRP